MEENQVFYADPRDDGEAGYMFLCPYCKKNHYHGLGEGHRTAHCDPDSPLYETGYTLKEREGIRYTGEHDQEENA